MDWRSLQDGMTAANGGKDKDFPDRTWRLLALSAVRDGKQYDHISTPFSVEASQGGYGEYIPLDQRRPSVQSGLCRKTVDDVVALLFGEGHFPDIAAKSETTVQAIKELLKHRHVNQTLAAAAVEGSVGSACIRMRILNRKVFLDVMPTAYVWPTWDPTDPDELLAVTEKYKVSPEALIALGYTGIDPLKGPYWYQRVWDRQAETTFVPWPVCDRDHVPVPDTDPARTVQHGLGFVPMVWVKNLPGGDDIDGACAFEPGISTVCEIDYLLSQAGRALKYGADPKLVVSDAGGTTTGFKGGAGNALILSDPQAKAELLEISGSAAAATLEHVSKLREQALEIMHGNRVEASKLSAATSGRALELMNQDLVHLADSLRVPYGEGALTKLYRMVCDASAVVKGGVSIGDVDYTNLDPAGISLLWPRWYAPSAEDRQAEATTLSALTAAGLMSRHTAVQSIADTYDVEDVEAEMTLIDADIAAADARAAALAAQVKATESLPA
jgi:hypothetical protein